MGSFLPQGVVDSPRGVVEMNHMTAFVYHSLSRKWLVCATFGGSSAKTMIQFCGGWTKVRYLLVSNDSLSVFMDGPGRGCCVACCVSRPALVALRISIRTDSSAAHWISTSYPQGFPLAPCWRCAGLCRVSIGIAREGKPMHTHRPQPARPQTSY